MTQSSQTSESERRIRAAVRAVMSPGVWLAVAMQLPTGLLVFRVIELLLSETPAQGQLQVFTMMLAVLFLGYLYLMSGTSRSFALGTATVSAQEALRRGRDVFNAFLWLAVKIFFLGLVASSVLLYFFGVAARLAGVSAEDDLSAVLGPLIKGIAVITPFALVYWLPVVFLRNDFRLLPTVGWALQIIWRQLPRSGFLVFLIFTPLAVFWLLPHGTPFVFMLVIALLSQLMAWTAYVYCVEVVADNPTWLGSTSPSQKPPRV